MQFKLKTLATVLSLCAIVPAASAFEQARVISSVAVTRDVPTSRDVCRDETVTTQGQKSGAGAVMGGIAGGALGTQIGKGNGRTAATILGLVGGAVLGNGIEGDRAPETRSVRNCHLETVMTSVLSGYRVVYELGGRQYATRMENMPGRTIDVELRPVGALEASVAVYESPREEYRHDARDSDRNNDSGRRTVEPGWIQEKR